MQFLHSSAYPIHALLILSIYYGNKLTIRRTDSDSGGGENPRIYRMIAYT